ncbi:hypothetical protein TNCV_1016041 [Trichonephila clavipes]|uniref:Uncharacterized protein n=1 Tax=Trichonephila clavipes TaxID=2585209 RepID=A0A8X7BA54_TRICX|nr:hypothetical protein TNCV_1016041 [Trichonephila clavipes]
MEPLGMPCGTSRFRGTQFEDPWNLKQWSVCRKLIAGIVSMESGAISDTPYKLKLSSATAHEGQGLQCPSQYTGPLDVEVHEQMSRSVGQSEA